MEKLNLGELKILFTKNNMSFNHWRSKNLSEMLEMLEREGYAIVKEEKKVEYFNMGERFGEDYDELKELESVIRSNLIEEFVALKIKKLQEPVKEYDEWMKERNNIAAYTLEGEQRLKRHAAAFDRHSVNTSYDEKPKAILAQSHLA